MTVATKAAPFARNYGVSAQSLASDLGLDSVALLKRKGKSSVKNIVSPSSFRGWLESSPSEGERWLRSAAQDGDSYAMQKRPVILGLVEQRYPSRDPVTAIVTRVRELSELGVLGVRFPEPWLLMLQSLLMSAGLRNSWRLEAVFQN